MDNIIKLFREFNRFFEIKFGWFFVNGRKCERWHVYISKKEKEQLAFSEGYKNTLK